MFKNLSIFVLCLTLLPIAKGEEIAIETVFVQLFASSENDGCEVFRAMDGSDGTIWHTQYNTAPSGVRAACPHPFPCGYNACELDRYSVAMPPPANTERISWLNVPYDKEALEATQAQLFGIAKGDGNDALGIDLGGVYPLTGFTYTPRYSNGNGTFAKYELYVAKDAEDGKVPFGEPIAKGEFSGKEEMYTIGFGKTVETRYLKFIQISELNGGTMASIAECQPIAAGYRFLCAGNGVLHNGSRMVARIPDVPDDPALQERVDEWNLLAERFENLLYWEAIQDEVASRASLFHPEDRDPLDVLIRRVMTTMGIDRKNENFPDGVISTYYKFEKAANVIPIENVAERFKAFCSLADYRRYYLLEPAAGPLKDAPREYLFIKRHRSAFDHMCDQFYGRCQPPGGGLYVLNIGTGQVRNLLENSVVESGRLQGQKLDKGSFLSPDVSFDGTKIAFAYVECDGGYFVHIDTLDVTRGHSEIGRSYHIFTCNADGTELRQITDGTWNDFDPCWLPNGRLAFISERRNGYLRCGRDCPTYTLFDMNPDGTQMRPLSFHETNEWNPSVTNDGKIIYTRWDYVDRYGCTVHHPWVTTLDGRDPREIHGNYSPRHRRADMELSCRAIPDSHKFIATAAAHHNQFFGSIIMIDPRVEDDDAMRPVKRITPDVGFPESQEHGYVQVYGTPWALSEEYFLCVADFALRHPHEQNAGLEDGSYKRGNYGIYICDIHGNRELLYRDPDIASMSPMPLAARPMPHVLPTIYDPTTIEHIPYVGIRKGGRIEKREADGNVTESTQATGTLSLMNVYDSLRPLPEGAKITHLRIIQLLPMSGPSGYHPHEIGIREASSGDSVNLARWVLGTVPVEEDGSAYFEMPAQVEFLFQALDENGLAVQSMRSSSYVQPGETVSCIGCHEPKHSVIPAVQTMATFRPVSKIKPETVPGVYPFSYPLLVQPILDKHCVECHAKPESNTFSLAKEPISSDGWGGWNKFYASYNNLAQQYGFTSYGDPLRTTPGKFGAHAAPLHKILRDGHHDVKLSDEEMHRIVLWLDCLSNFYGVYEKEGGETQLRGEIAWPTLE